MPYFECLHCGTFTKIDATGPKCPDCGHGTGIIHQNEPPAVAAQRKSEKKDADERQEGRREPRQDASRCDRT